MREWFEQMSLRERNMVLACAALIVVALVWLLGLKPMFQGAAALEERVIAKQSQLANLQELASQVQPASAGSGGQQGRNESIVVVIDRTTRQRQLASYLKRNQPEGTGGVRLRFEGAPFDALVGWLGELNDQYGMTTVSATIDEAGPGRVNCSLVLMRSGA